MGALITQDRSIIISADVPDLEELRRLVVRTFDHPAVSAYKVGLRLVIPHGLTEVVRTVRLVTTKPVIYDMQKAATDIPDMGKAFAEACESAGVDSVILFPMTGPRSEEAFIEACQAAGLHVIVGGEMTHPGYLRSDGGWIEDSQLDNLYRIAAEMGVTDFVVPGNKPERIAHYRQTLGPNAVFYSPGLVTQGGEVSASATAAGAYWHAIVGRAIYQAEEPLKVIHALAAGLA